MMVQNELLGYERIKIYQDSEMFSFSIDSLLLPAFVRKSKKIKKIIDLGTGNAAIPLYLSVKIDAKIIGVEIQEKSFELARKSVQANQLEHQIELICDSFIGISDRVGKYCFDVVISNPPFFKLDPSSRINKNEYLTIARHEVKMTLEELVREASLLLNNGGSFYLIHRPDRLTDILSLMRKYNLEPKRIQFVLPRRNTQPNHVLIEAVKGRQQGGLVVLKPLIVYTKDRWTKDIINIYNIGRDSYVTESIKS
ncbi:MAG: tRNA1(Val) (adenine(37)-N6)-methyltransferase [Acholeplasma sp.]|nr:tRNA1(Val) (adenine(37)-N6)-methyltransferase [Acholeplasma sp.]